MQIRAQVADFDMLRSNACLAGGMAVAFLSTLTSALLIYDGFLANSDAATYDYIGRFFYLRLTQAY